MSPSPRPDTSLGEGTVDVLRRWHAICRQLDRADDCDHSLDYARDWDKAMEADLVALGPRRDEATRRQLTRLVATVGSAARAGSLMIPGPCGDPVPAFPLTRSLLPAFGRLFVQGMVGAGRNQPEQVRTAADLAEALLASTGIKDNSRVDAPATPCA